MPAPQWLTCGLPDSPEGWKIHVSSGPVSLELVVSVVRETSDLLQVPYKVLTDPRDVAELNSGRLGWTQVGKVATLYTSTDDQASSAADMLESRLRGIKGPIVEGDIQISTVAPLHARWGSFYTPKRDPLWGGHVTTVSGHRVPDNRYRPQHEALGRAHPFQVAHYRSPGTPWRNRYCAVELLQHTGSSAVYAGLDLVDKVPCAIKVRRNLSSIDRSGRDGTARLKREFEGLQKYGPLLSGPSPMAFVHETDRSALVMELVRGQRLDLLREPPTNLSALCSGLRSLVAKAHEQRLLVRDLRPENLIVTDSGCIRLIDFEFVGPEGEDEYDSVAGVTSGPRALRHTRNTDNAAIMELSKTLEVWRFSA